MIRSIVFIYFYFIALIISHDLDEEFLLCKNCGHEIAHIKHIKHFHSPLTVKTWQDREFLKTHGHGNGLKIAPTIQLIRNNLGNEFNLLTVTQASMLLLNHTTSMEYTWFPKFTWTIGVCPGCKKHIGWYYQSTESNESFYGLVFDYLFNEDEAEDLVMIPRLKMQ